MHNMQIKMKFVQLKAEGLPLYKIAKAIGVHRTTLTLWHKELAEYILIAKQDYIDELLFENNNTKFCRIEAISRHISELYSTLEEPWNSTKSGLYYDEVLNSITKFTKLLHLEYNEKPLERLMKNNEKAEMNFRKKNHKENAEEEESEKQETPIWITDIDAFRMIQPDEDSPKEEIEMEEENENVNDMVIEAIEETREISDEDPEIQKIFKRTIERSMTEEKRKAYLEESENYYNSLKKKDDAEEDKLTAIKSVKNPSNKVEENAEIIGEEILE